MRIRVAAIVVSGLLPGLVSQAPAATAVSRSIPELALEADVVLVGSVGTYALGSGSAPTALSVVPTRVLIGQGVLSPQPMYTAPALLRLAVPALQGPPSLWFVKMDANHQPTILPTRVGSHGPAELSIPLPAGPLPAAYQYQDDDHLIDKLAAELAYAAEAADAAIASRAHDAMRSLLATRPAGAPSAYHHLVALGRAHAASCRISTILATWDSNVVARVSSYVGSHEPETLPTGLLRGLCTVQNPSALPGVQGLLDNPRGGPSVLDCARRAVRNIHTSAALPRLAAFLDDPSLEVQYLGVSGLAMFANNVGQNGAGPHGGPISTSQTLANAPGWETFRQQPEAYRAFWKNWYPNRAPAVTASGGGASCHPVGRWTPCTVPLSATGTDGNGDPLLYTWSGCSKSGGPVGKCNVNQLGPATATVTASDGRGGTASASQTVTGVNSAPTITCPGNVTVPQGSTASVYFTWADADHDTVACAASVEDGSATIRSCHVPPSSYVDVRACNSGSGCYSVVHLRVKDGWAQSKDCKFIVTGS